MSPNGIDRDEIIRACNLYVEPGGITELRILDAVTGQDRRPHVESGYFNDWTKLADAAARITAADAFYILPNVVNPALLARAANRLRAPGKKPTTCDADIMRRRWLLVDFDAARAAGISSTDAEHQAALDLARRVADELDAEDWTRPLIGDSGNGGHLMWPVDLPADDGGLVERCLHALAAKYDCPAATVDCSVFNPARIWKLYGTMARKGDSTADRPHRMARLLDVPSPLGMVSIERLQELAAQVAKPAEPAPRVAHRHNGESFDLARWIREHGLDVDGPDPWKGGQKWVFKTCPYNAQHTNRSAWLAQLASGAIAAGCHHAGCSGKDWYDLRDLIEPGWRGNGQHKASARAKAEPVEGGGELVGGPIIDCAADIRPRSISWLWEGHFPLACASMLCGRPGGGKSLCAYEMAAHVTRGTPWPDGTPCPQGEVIIIAGEDDAPTVGVPRLIAAGADLRRVHIFSMVRHVNEDGQHCETMFSLADLPTLEAVLKAHPDCKLVIIDPVGSFLPGKVDANRENEVRAILGPLCKLAERHGVAVLLVAHPRKAYGENADDLALGSRAFTGIVRAVWHLSRDRADRDRRLLLPGKCNLSREPDGLAFRLKGDPPHIVWEAEPVKMNADDALIGDAERRGPEPEARDAAEAWLRQILAAGPVASGDLHKPAPGTIRALAKEADLKWPTVRRAADKLGVRRERNTYSKAFEWRLPKPGNLVAQAVAQPPIGTSNMSNMSNMTQPIDTPTTYEGYILPVAQVAQVVECQEGGAGPAEAADDAEPGTPCIELPNGSLLPVGDEGGAE